MWALYAIVCPCKRKTDGDLKDRKREGNVIREADIGVMRAQAGGCLQLPEAGKSKERVSPAASQENKALRTP